jgi:Fur family transcriptional regulator, ferric uptake regulator
MEAGDTRSVPLIAREFTRKSGHQRNSGTGFPPDLPPEGGRYNAWVKIGANKSLKRDRIVDVFFRQEGHVSADELFEAVRQQYPRIGRATVYRTLQRMVAAGLAHKVDFGEGRARYEASPGRPRHFHLICTVCHSSSEFLSSDIESQLDEIAEARGFTAHRTVVQIHGVCEQCRTGKSTPSIDGSSTSWVFARDALRIAIDTERHGLEFYTRAAKVTKEASARAVFQSLARAEREHLAKLEERHSALMAQHPWLETRPTFLFFKRPASGLFAAGVDQLREATGAADALRIGIECERGSHRFFKQYGEQFEDSEGKRIFLEFADEERDHLNLLTRELRAAAGRRRKSGTARTIPRKKAD